MGLFDKLIGTRYPDDGVAPSSAEEVRAALLGVNRPDAPYVIRGGGAEARTWWRSGGCGSPHGRTSSCGPS
jgi:hypothetical protein